MGGFPNRNLQTSRDLLFLKGEFCCSFEWSCTYSTSYGLDGRHQKYVFTYGLVAGWFKVVKWPELNPSRIEWDRIPRDPDQ